MWFDYISCYINNYDAKNNTFIAVILNGNLGIKCHNLSLNNLQNFQKENFYIYTHFQISNNVKVSYYAFISFEHLILFQKLLKISGIGIKYAEEIFYLYLNNELINAKAKFQKFGTKTFLKICKVFTL